MPVDSLPRMISRRRLDLMLLAWAVACSRFAFRRHDVYDLDFFLLPGGDASCQSSIWQT
jgi:hypothetical protein